jgi:Glycosyltransferase family 87
MRGARIWVAAYWLVVAAFLGLVARYYHPQFGFTAFIEFPEGGHESELPAVREAPHFHHPGSGGYDGQFYAQLAVEPLLKDPAIDGAMDNAPYRAHRILFPWIAWALGRGRAASILQAAAIEDVLVWLALAWLLSRVIPPVSARAFVLWSGCLLAHGMLMSVRYALPDALAMLLIAMGVFWTERGRPILAAITIGVAGLARETSVIAATALARFLKRAPRSWIIAVVCVVLVMLPTALWLDYLRSIYRLHFFEGAGNISRPFLGLLWKVRSVWHTLARDGFSQMARDDLFALVAFLTQAAWLVWRFVKRRDLAPWALAAASFLVLALFAHQVVWDGTPGAYTRVTLPLTIGVNVLLSREDRAPWWVIGLANLSVVPGVALMMAFHWP